MDNNKIISKILHACRQAQEMEANLSDLASQHPSVLRSSCEEVVRAFNNAIHELDLQEQGLQAMDLFGLSSMDQESSPFFLQRPPENEMCILPLMETLGFGSSQDIMGEVPFLGAAGEQVPQATMAVAGSSTSLGLMGRRPNSGSTGQLRQSRKRKDKGMRRIRVPAVRAGNIENPPDDGYTWRKYGQKDILGSRFPRSYFRCTHKNFYGCLAKKQVQRLDEDPYSYEVTYCGDHTCQTNTAPLILPPLVTTNPLQTDINAISNATQALSSSSHSTSIQLGSHWFDLGAQRQYHPHGGESSGGVHAGTSECPVADLADAMFNSGSSGSSMDAIFSIPE